MRYKNLDFVKHPLRYKRPAGIGHSLSLRELGSENQKLLEDMRIVGAPTF